MDNMRSTVKHGEVTDRAFLFSALRQPNTILLESSRQDDQNRATLLFHAPDDILVAYTLKDIPVLFQKIERCLQQGKWIAGYFGYECGYHFENIIRDFDNRTTIPLAYLCAYHSPLTVPQEFLEVEIPSAKAKVYNPHFSISVSTYFHNLERIRKYIVNGDTYQVNFTDRYEFIFSGDELELYMMLREKQHVPFGGFLNLDEIQILSFSPELFFRRKENTITTKPMKGTCSRGRTNEEDRLLSNWLHHDEKNRSENLMIVDLLRNDLGKICIAGSVKVQSMFDVERYETVLQMTSTIQGVLTETISYYDIFKALFPCGSVTGAPKIRTMQIIHETERHQRGVYCGAIGFISPNTEAVFNVAIRTIVLNNSIGTLGVGGGIVFDSEAAKEYQECALKASFLLNEPERFEIIETLLWKNGYHFLNEHLKRMEKSAEFFFYAYNRKKILDTLKAAERTFQKDKEYRVRLSLSRTGIPYLSDTELQPVTYKPIIKIAAERTDSTNRFFYHKTSHRALYNRYHERAQKENIADYIFLNEKEEITEGSITNVFIESNNQLFTSPVSCGLLAGIYRNYILQSYPTASEKVLTLKDLRNADAIFICNSVRGLQKVRLGEP